MVINVPFLQEAFETTSLSPGSWAIVIGAASTIVPALEVAKRVVRRSKEIEAA